MRVRVPPRLEAEKEKEKERKKDTERQKGETPKAEKDSADPTIGRVHRTPRNSRTDLVIAASGAVEG